MNTRYLNVGSWNIEHYGAANHDNNVFALAEHIEMAGCDILVLQELYVTSDEGRQNKFLAEALALVKEHTGRHWKYEIFANRFNNDTEQLCGVAWDADRVEHQGTFPIPVKFRKSYRGRQYWLWDRWPHAVKFSAGEGKTDLIVVSLHMKANTAPPAIVRKTREMEVLTLLDQLDKIKEHFEGEEDIIFLGDTNCKNNREKAIEAFVDAGFEDLNEDDITTYFKGDEAPFDRIFIPNREERKAFRYSRQYILRAADPMSHDRYLSDHYVVKTSVKVVNDDDNP